MHRYLISIPWIVKKLFPSYIWSMPAQNREVYLTFDDGPHPSITPWVLDQLNKFNAKATFFCIGRNVADNPGVYERILSEGHAVGNHTFNHLNGSTTDVNTYIENIRQAGTLIHSSLFRPPYGRIKRSQAKAIWQLIDPGMKIIMWDVLSADFDRNFTPEQCARNVTANVKSGSVIVFHDSEKAYVNLAYSLPVVLSFLAENGYTSKVIG